MGGVGESKDGGEALLKKDFAPVDGRGSLGNPKTYLLNENHSLQFRLANERVF